MKVRLVEEAFAAGRAAKTWDSVVAVPFPLEFVIVGELLAWVKGQQDIFVQ